MKRLLISAAVVSLLTVSPALADCDDGETVIRFSHVVKATGHPKGDAATLLSQMVNEEMNGKACMEVYPNSQLYDDDKVMEALLLGDVQLAAPSLSKFEAYTLKYRLFDLPFLFKDLSSVERFQKSENGQSLLNEINGVGFQGLAYWNSGVKQFSANKPLLVPSDADGLKFRIQTSDVAQAMISAMGGNAQKLAFKEVYGALQTGVVDGQENSWSNIYTQKFFEVQDGITETNHQLLAYMVVTSTDWLESLDADVRDQFLSILETATNAANKQVAETEAKNKQRIIDAGVEVRKLTPEQSAVWVSTMKPVWDQFEGDIGIDNINAAMASN